MIAPTAAPPHFMVVGSPRSGTTLVQRLLTELPGVQVTAETHFYSLFYESHLRRVRFPVPVRDVRALLTAYAALPQLYETPVDVDGALDQLPATVPGPHAIFGALTRSLAPGVSLVGEKTPNHLRWWRPVMRAAPTTRLVLMVRDPRAVVASTLRAPFGMSSAALIAAAWCRDIEEVIAASAALTPAQACLVRYEDVVADPDAVRDRLAHFLGVETATVPLGEHRGATLFPPSESGWKSRALGRVDPTRALAWRNDLSPGQLRQVEAVAHRAMTAQGYYPETGAHRLWELSAGDHARLLWHGLRRRAERRRIGRTDVGEPLVAHGAGAP